jgi:AraC-like DNA-binding protein
MYETGLRERGTRAQTGGMHGTVHRSRLAPSAPVASVVAAVLVDEFDRDVALVSLPRPEFQVIARFGPSARGGLDVHAFGPRDRAHRKVIRGGQRAVTARLRLGATEAVFGVPASALAGRIVALEDLWGEVATRRLCDCLAAARSMRDAAAIVESAIGGRLARVDAARAGPHAGLALEAAARLARTSVNAVAAELGVSERHLRRVFHDVIGVSPKAFAKLARFHRALTAARANRAAGWASIAAGTGYYDQAHLIGEFRAIAGATPRALLGELDGMSRPAATAARRNG